MKFHTLKVSQIESLTPLSKKISFEIPAHLSNDFSFLPGQYITMELLINGHPVKRSYSICSSNNDKNTISVGVKKVEQGLASSFINNTLLEGTSLPVSTPEGLFLLPSSLGSQDYVFVAGGSGITPILSMLYHILPNCDRKVFLKYSTLHKEETMFYGELQKLASSYPQLQIDWLYTQGENILNESNIAEWISSLGLSNYEVWVCGPAGIISSTEKACESIGLDKEKFHREYFTAKAEGEAQTASVGSGTESPLAPGESAEVEIKFEGKKLTFTCKYNETILDAALNAGGDPPYSCLVAACSTCRAMCKQGNIEMKDRDALSDKDIAKGFVLTCQALPRSKKIQLDYDI
jgi:ferredoxin-NADP reductase